MALLEAFAHPLEPADAMRGYAQVLQRRLAATDAEEMLAEMVHREFRGRIALVSSFGAESAVLLHMAARIDRALPVIFVDTGKIFGSTHGYREELVQRLGLTDVRLARPDPAVLTTQDTDSGLWLRDPDACCDIRKVAPLARALGGFDAWISGRKRYQGGLRQKLPLFEADGSRIKVNPLADWSRAEIDAYRVEHDLPEHPLVADGFRSIGCMPCTDRVATGEDQRSGRWRGRGKTECGIHLGLASFEAEGRGL